MSTIRKPVVGAHADSCAVGVDLAEVARRRGDRRELARPLPVFGAEERPGQPVADGAGEAWAKSGDADPGALEVLADAVLVGAYSPDAKVLVVIEVGPHVTVSSRQEWLVSNVLRHVDDQILCPGTDGDRRRRFSGCGRCREAVANALKHARATKIEVGIRAADGQLLVEVYDDGVGGVSPLGLTGLRDRVSSLDGRLGIDSVAGIGTTIRAVL